MTVPQSSNPRGLRSLSGWDARLAGESAAFTVVFLALVTLVTAVSDEGGISWHERVARSIPVGPLCAALASGFALASRARRGEARALEALGRAPLVYAGVAALGAVAVALLLGTTLLVASDDWVRPFFPSVPSSGAFTFADGTFSNPTQGWRVLEDGRLSFLGRSGVGFARASGSSADGLPPHARMAASLITVLGSMAFTFVVAVVVPRRPVDPRPGSRWLTAGLALLVTSAATVFCLEAAASRRVDPLVAALPSTMLLLGLASAIVRCVWQAARSPLKHRNR